MDLCFQYFISTGVIPFGKISNSWWTSPAWTRPCFQRKECRSSYHCSDTLPETPASIVDAPNLDDVVTICSVLESLGVKVQREDNVLTFDASGVNKTEASYELMSRMRASFLIMGPLLAKMGHAKIALPGAA